jgi:hypothetical protein
MRVLGRHFFLILAVLAFISIPIATSFSQTPPLRFAKPLLYGWGMDGFAVADVNGDGHLDIVAVWNQDNVGVLLGKGNGKFQPVVEFPSGGSASFSVAIADVNGDGKADIVALNRYPGTGVAGVLLGNGDGSFQPPVTYSTGDAYGSQGLAVGDLNGDGHSDIAVAEELCPRYTFCQGFCGCVGVLYNNGDGTFKPQVQYAPGGYSTNSITIADGFWIVTNSCLDEWCDTNLGTVCCGYSCYTSGGEGPFWPTPAATGDLNGDGNFDIVVANTGGDVGVLLGNGFTSFQPVHFYTAGEAIYAAVGDVNGDGKPDIVVSDRRYIRDPRYGTGVLLGKGDGTFQTMVNFGWVGDILVLGDLNDDGKLDLIGGEGVMLNTSGFYTKTQITSSLNPSFVNQSVTFTATVTSKHGPIPDGEVANFYSGTKLLASVPLSGGAATYTTSTLTAETHIMQAKYPGDTTFQSSAGRIQQVVQ